MKIDSNTIAKFICCQKIDLLHRFVYDKIYIQRNETEQKKFDELYPNWKEDLALYKQYYKLYPDFRQFLYDFSQTVNKKYIKYKYK